MCARRLLLIKGKYEIEFNYLNNNVLIIFSNLRAHVQTHSSAKPFLCYHCGKRFALKSYLYKHQDSLNLKPSQSSPRTSAAGSSPLVAPTTSSSLFLQQQPLMCYDFSNANFAAEEVEAMHTLASLALMPSNGMDLSMPRASQP